MSVSHRLEVCCGSLLSVRRAAEGGAYRVELCSGLAEGGLTPSLALIEATVQVAGLRRHVLVRPRPGDFLYDAAEQALIVRDIRLARQAGVDGVVVGALTPDGDIDEIACQRFVSAATAPLRQTVEGGVRDVPPVALTFHRAFGMPQSPFRFADPHPSRLPARPHQRSGPYGSGGHSPSEVARCPSSRAHHHHARLWSQCRQCRRDSSRHGCYGDSCQPPRSPVFCHALSPSRRLNGYARCRRICHYGDQRRGCSCCGGSHWLDSLFIYFLARVHPPSLSRRKMHPCIFLYPSVQWC